MCQGLLEPEFYCDLVYNFKKIVGTNNLSAQFIKIISHNKKISYIINVLRQTTCSWLINLLSSLIARRLVQPQTLCRFQLKDLSIDERFGA